MAKRSHIYLDYAAATPTALPVVRAMQPYWNTMFGNPSSLHTAGRKAARVLTDARVACAAFINARPSEILFTSGGTESINLALTGFVAARERQTGQQTKPRQQRRHGRQHIITTTIEHPAARATVLSLQEQGHDVTFVPCNTSGIVDARRIIAAIKKNTTIISVIMVQNEIGTIQPIAEIGKLLVQTNRERTRNSLTPIAFHTDACQAPAWLPLNVETLHVDLLSLDAAKMYGPKGIGLLYRRARTPLAPLLHGGGQEHELRSGTEPIALIAGLAAAGKYVTQHRGERGSSPSRLVSQITTLRNHMMQRLEAEIPGCVVTGDRVHRIANNVHITIPHREGDDLVLRLDRQGIAASTGSACSSAEVTESHIMNALQLPANRIAGSIRFTLGYQTMRTKVDSTITTLKKILAIS